MRLIAAGDVSDYTADVRAGIRDRFAEAAGVHPSGVSVEITAASVRIDAVVVGAPANFTERFATRESATAFLEGVQLAGGGRIEVESVDALVAADDALRADAPVAADDASHVWVGCAVGVALLLVLLLLVVRRRRRTKVPSLSTPRARVDPTVSDARHERRRKRRMRDVAVSGVEVIACAPSAPDSRI